MRPATVFVINLIAGIALLPIGTYILWDQPKRKWLKNATVILLAAVFCLTVYWCAGFHSFISM